MSRPSLYARGLDLRIAAGRVRPLVWLTVLLIVGSTIGQAWLLHDLRTQRLALANRLHALRRPGAAVPVTPLVHVSAAAERLGDFQRVLGDGDHQEELIRAMFANARQSELLLAEGEYTGAPDKSGMYETLEVSQPVRGSYQQVRAYCERTLATMPFAALDALQFKREGVAAATGEARIQWTLYLRPGHPVESSSRGRP